MLVSVLMDKGINLMVIDDHLQVDSDARLTEKQRKYLNDHKDQLLTELADLEKVNAWLDHIGEDDPQCRAEVLENCKDTDGRDYFLQRYKADLCT